MAALSEKAGSQRTENRYCWGFEGGPRGGLLTGECHRAGCFVIIPYPDVYRPQFSGEPTRPRQEQSQVGPQVVSILLLVAVSDSMGAVVEVEAAGTDRFFNPRFSQRTRGGQEIRSRIPVPLHASQGGIVW